MQRELEQDEVFERAKTYSRIRHVVQWAIYFLSVLGLIWDSFEKANTILLAVLLLVNLGVSYLFEATFDNANDLRIKSLFDNAFRHNRLPGFDGDNYFNNADQKPGIVKLISNFHENAYFTAQLSSQALSFNSFVLAIVVLVFIVAVFIKGLDDYTSLFLNFIASGILISKVCNLANIKTTATDCLSKLNDLCSHYESDRDTDYVASIALELLVRYEAALWSARIILPEKIYKKMEPELSKNWENIKHQYLFYRDH